MIVEQNNHGLHKIWLWYFMLHRCYGWQLNRQAGTPLA
jgi:hypothetical protein